MMGRFLLTFLFVSIPSIHGFTGEEAGLLPDPVMGDYEGSYSLEDGSGIPLSAQIIAIGNGEYQANILRRFDQPEPPTVILKGQRSGASFHFSGKIEEGEYTGLKVEGDIKNGKFTGNISSEENNIATFDMEKTVRLSPTLGAKPPQDADILFDGTNFEQWEQISRPRGFLSRLTNLSRKNKVRWKLIDGAMEIKPGSGSIITKNKFFDFRIHLEFRTPFMPEARGQDRGNSGLYLQERYEVQILDSYGLEGLDNECGGIYKVAAPRINMCAPPQQWQTYDITFHAPRFDSDGNKTEDALLTVLHNGIQIHHNVEVDGPTGSAQNADVKKSGGIYLQDHGNRVQYRNIWLIELPEE